MVLNSEFVVRLCIFGVLSLSYCFFGFRHQCLSTASSTRMKNQKLVRIVQFFIFSGEHTHILNKILFRCQLVVVCLYFHCWCSSWCCWCSISLLHATGGTCVYAQQDEWMMYERWWNMWKFKKHGGKRVIASSILFTDSHISHLFPSQANQLFLVVVSFAPTRDERILQNTLCVREIFSM